MKAIVPFLAAALLAGCTHSTKNIYDAADVGRTISTSEATVVSSRVVQISEQSQGAGPLAGAAAGAGIGGLSIGEGRGSGLAALLGGLLGAGAGYLTENSLQGREGIEYVLRANDGRVFTLVQNRADGETPIAAGTPVLVQYGRYVRVIEKPATLQGAVDPAKNPTPAALPPPAGNPPDFGTVRPIGGAPRTAS